MPGLARNGDKMTSEIQLKQERQRVLDQWQVLGEQVKLVGLTLDSSPDYTSYQDYIKACTLQAELVEKLALLWQETDHYVLNNFHNI